MVKIGKRNVVHNLMQEKTDPPGVWYYDIAKGEHSPGASYQYIQSVPHCRLVQKLKCPVTGCTIYSFLFFSS